MRRSGRTLSRLQCSGTERTARHAAPISSLSSIVTRVRFIESEALLILRSAVCATAVVPSLLTPRAGMPIQMIHEQSARAFGWIPDTETIKTCQRSIAMHAAWELGLLIPVLALTISLAIWLIAVLLFPLK